MPCGSTSAKVCSGGYDVRRPGQRQYDEETIRRLASVRRATALGFSLAEVKSLLTLRVSARTPCERVRERARRTG